jgi:hypothetical protein
MKLIFTHMERYRVSSGTYTEQAATILSAYPNTAADFTKITAQRNVTRHYIKDIKDIGISI